MKNIGFNNDLYIKMQTAMIEERINLFDKLYLEVGGKLFDDNHASRVLPGFEKTAKIQVLEQLKENLEIIICISAKDIESRKIRFDQGITYDVEVIRLIENFKERKLKINSVVITLFNGEESALAFKKMLENYHIKTYISTYTKGYPTDVKTIVSPEGYGKNEFIKTTAKLIVVTAPGPNSGKLATCLSQLYHEYLHNIKAGYAKFETFPVWNLSINDPVNYAYEAATAALNDQNMIDNYHLNKYQIIATNYNRDLEVFPVLREILNKILNKEIYYSPTDMGINTIKEAITNKKIVDEAAKLEIIRRYLIEKVNFKLGKEKENVYQKIKLIMNKLAINENDFDVRTIVLNKAGGFNGNVSGIKINNKIITGKEKNLLTSSSAMLLNTIKFLSNIPDDMDLLAPNILEPLKGFKKNQKLEISELLIALNIASVTNPIIKKALKNLEKLQNSFMHVSYIINPNESHTLKSLGINVTCEDKFQANYFNF